MPKTSKDSAFPVAGLFSLPKKYWGTKEAILPDAILEVLPELIQREKTQPIKVTAEIVMPSSDTVSKVYGPYETGIQSARNPENRKMIVHFTNGEKKSMKLAEFRAEFPDLISRLERLTAL